MENLFWGGGGGGHTLFRREKGELVVAKIV